MRRYILLFIILCLHLSARGQTQYEYRYWFDGDISTAVTGSATSEAWRMEVDLSRLKESFHTIHLQVTDEEGVSSAPVTRSFFFSREGRTLKNGFYWFDDEAEARSVNGNKQGILTFDVSDQQEGFHTLHYQVQSEDGSYSQAETRSFYKVQSDQVTGQLTFLCYIDGMPFKQERVSADNGVATWLLDVVELPIGFHKLQIRAITEKGAATSVRESFFLRNATDSELNALSCIFSIDGQTYKIIENGVTDGMFHCDLDVAPLPEGLHKISYYLTNGQGAQTTVKTQYFIKQPIGGNSIKKYQYWVNENDDMMHTIIQEHATDPFPLISLLPVEQQPLRSKSFHFEIKDGQPCIFAKNTFHVRFFDAAMRFTDAAEDYIDYAVSQELTDIDELVSGVRETTDMPAVNVIKWYRLEVDRGDSLRFRADKACTMQLFAPSGAEIYNVYGSAAVKWGGLHAKETGTYYLALHDVTATKGTKISVDYMHIDKYAVLRQDVRIVGNEGYSTITFEGNGFKDLYQVLLINAQTDTIACKYIGHESDAITTVAFNFDGSSLGNYNAVFKFTEGTITMANCISVKEATDIALSIDFSAPHRYLRNRTVTYTLNISNKGNMTAYKVPLLCYIVSDTPDGIRKLKFEGLNLPSLYDLVNKDTLSSAERNELKLESDEIGDLHYLVPFISSEDSIAVRTGNIYVDIGPNSTKTIRVSMTGSELIHAYFALPDGWEPAHNDTLFLSSSNFDDNRSARRNMRKVRWKCYTCYKEEITCMYQLVETYVSFLNPAAGCAMGVGSIGLCHLFGGNCTYSWASALLDCVPGGKLGKMIFYKQSLDIHVNCLPLLGRPGKNNKRCCDLIYDKPVKPVNSLDPNDIYGYEAKSGSRLVADSITALNYRIEFENDTTFATAAAHVVEIRDTLDRNVFDLTSYAPTSFKIGDKTEYLSGTPEFVCTIDMRPAINAIAQVEGKFDEQKGIATWLFTSLDPMTMEPTDDVMQGFLPVNFDGVSGIGEVSFDISRKAGLPDGTMINNRASIVFDTNEAILTPTWTNIVDAVPPSSIIDNSWMVNDSTLRITADASDVRSGVWKYTWYVQAGENAPWWNEGETDSCSFDYHIYEGIDYGFCVLATDSAGNVEQKVIERERSFKTYGQDYEDTIEEVPAMPDGEDTPVYDLSGRQIVNDKRSNGKYPRGVIIRNRKKTLVTE